MNIYNYFVYDVGTPGRQAEDALFPELYLGGKWVERETLVHWDTKADSASKAEVDALIADISAGK